MRLGYSEFGWLGWVCLGFMYLCLRIGNVFLVISFYYGGIGRQVLSDGGIWTVHNES